jgi:hypothetical protein
VQVTEPDRPFADRDDQEIRAELAALLAKAGVGVVIDVTPVPVGRLNQAPIPEETAKPSDVSALGELNVAPPAAHQTCRVCGCIDEAAVVWIAADLCARCAKETD